MSAARIVVVGAGVAGLAAATAIRREAPGVDVLVLEATRRAGGLVESERTPGGFVLEHGADCLVTTHPSGIASACAAGLEGAIVAGSGRRQTYVATGDRLVPMPQIFAGIGLAAAISLLRSPLLSIAGKARIALEPLLPVPC